MALENPPENPIEILSENDILYKMSQIQNDPQDAKQKVDSFLKETSHFLVNKLFATTFVMTTSQKNNACLGLIHVYIRYGKPVCAGGRGCNRAKIGTSKKRFQFLKCPHEEIINILIGKNYINSKEESTSRDREDCKKIYETIDVTSKYMLDSQKVPYSEKDIKEIEHNIMYMNLSGTWPTVFKPEETECNNCSSSNLSSLQPHPGHQQAHLLTASKYTLVSALVRKCNNCQRLIQYYNRSILNIGDSLFVSMDVIFMMKDSIEEGTPPSTAAKICLKSLCRKSPHLNQRTQGCVEYIARMLTGGFYAVEALDVKDSYTARRD